jgi:hypothetical protein
MRSSRLAGLALAAAVAMTAGCGGDDKKADTTTASATTATESSTTPTQTQTTPSENTKNDPSAGRVVQAFYNAMAQRDGNKACTYLNQDLKQTAVGVVRRSNRTVKSCGPALTASVSRNTAAQLRTLRNVKILSSTAEGALATVKMKSAPRDVLLTRDGGHWLISSGVFAT